MASVDSSSKSVGQHVAKVTALQQRNDELEATVQKQGEQIAELLSKVAVLTAGK